MNTVLASPYLYLYKYYLYTFSIYIFTCADLQEIMIAYTSEIISNQATDCIINTTPSMSGENLSSII